jgi:hypothetical protein
MLGRPTSAALVLAVALSDASGLEALIGDAFARLAGIVEKIKVNQTGSIGVIGEDKNGCYSAILYKAWSEGTQKMLVRLDAATVLSKRAIAVRRYAVYQNPETIDAILAKLEDNVAALIAANP